MGGRGFISCGRLAAVALAAAAAAVALACAEGRSSAERGGTGPGFPPPTLPAPATVWAVGDGADGSVKAKALAAMIEEREPRRFLYLGDVYEHGTAQEFTSNYAPVYGRFDAVAAPTTGNHEWGNRDAGYFPYWGAAKGTGVPLWYSFRVAGWQLLSLSSEAPHSSSSEQIEWLRQRLRETREQGTCRLAFWHRPRYSAGSHGDDADIEPFWDALEKRARLVVNGHDHSMQRLRSRRGIVGFVSGAGGHKLTGVDDGDPRVAFKAERREGALRLRLRRHRARFAFVATNGEKLDSGTVRCRRD